MCSNSARSPYSHTCTCIPCGMPNSTSMRLTRTTTHHLPCFAQRPTNFEARTTKFQVHITDFQVCSANKHSFHKPSDATNPEKGKTGSPLSHASCSVLMKAHRELSTEIRERVLVTYLCAHSIDVAIPLVCTYVCMYAHMQTCTRTSSVTSDDI